MSIHSGPRSASRAILRSAGILTAATAASRLLGFLRDWLIAFLYGTSLPAQAFVVAFRIPNLLRTLVGEGAASSAFVPVFSRTHTLEGEGSWRKLAQALWGHLLLFFFAVCVLGVLGAEWAVRMVAPGFEPDPDLFALTVRLTRILFPFVGLVGVAAFTMGLLNSVGHFVRPSLGPIVLNACMIAGMLLWRQDAVGLAWGVIAGGVLELVVQWPALQKAGLSWRPSFREHPGVAQIRRILIPRVAGTAVYQTAVLVDTIFASFQHWVGAGGVAALYFAHRFLQLPLGLFGVSMAQASLPAMASLVASDDRQTLRETFALALRSSLFVALPSSVGLLVLAHPIIQTLLEHGAFSAAATRMTVSALQWYALGLSALCAVKVLVNTLYAHQDTWTPVRSAAAALVVNILLNFLLIGPMGLAGLALATSVSTGVNALHLYGAVRRLMGPLNLSLKGWAARVSLAALGQGVGVTLLWRWGEAAVVPQGTAWAVGWLMLTLSAGVASFFGLAFALNVPEARRVLAWIFRRS